MLVEEFITGFVKNTNGKVHVCGRWSSDKIGEIERLVYSPTDTTETEEVAYKLPDGSVLSNANQLQYVGRKFAWGHEISWRRGNETDEQRLLINSGAIPLPFTLFHEANLDVRSFSWIVKPVAEKVIEKIERFDYTKQHNVFDDNPRHFSGACLFMIGDHAYLFDIDRKEIKENGIFNPFLTKLLKRVESVADAYDLLIPDTVKQAMQNGIEVQRQGEFFFVKYSDECPLKHDLTPEELQVIRYPPSKRGYGFGDNDRFSYASEDSCPFEKDDEIDTPEKREFQEAALRYKELYKRYREQSPKEGTLGKSATGSHSIEKYIQIGDDIFASGIVKQARRQHGDLVLKGWYQVYANTGTLSWTVTGKID